MRHLIRAGGLLLGILAVVFVVPRMMPVTESLVGYGFYPRNDTGNAIEWSSLPAQYVDSSICSSCHQDNGSAWAASKHSNVACEDCHGPGRAHIDRSVALTIDTARESCALCHAKVVGRPASFPQVDLATHGGQSTCVTCHNPHNPQTVSTRELPVIPHSLEGRNDCLLCHNVGGIKPAPADHNGRTSATCLSCHKSK